MATVPRSPYIVDHNTSRAKWDMKTMAKMDERLPKWVKNGPHYIYESILHGDFRVVCFNAPLWMEIYILAFEPSWSFYNGLFVFVKCKLNIYIIYK
jgi:hypothetical protein